jgi:hypothetical protein
VNKKVVLDIEIVAKERLLLAQPRYVVRQKCGTVYGGMDRSGVRMGSPLTGMSENAQVRNNPKAANLPTTAKPTTTTRNNNKK